MATSSERAKTFRLEGEDVITAKLLAKVAKCVLPNTLTLLAIGELGLEDAEYECIVAPNTYPKDDHAYRVSKIIDTKYRNIETRYLINIQGEYWH